MKAHFTHTYSLEEYKQKLKKILKSYTKKEILSDGSVKKTVIEDDYLLRNDTWTYDFFVLLPQFQEKLLAYRNNPVNHIFIINFNSENELINLELKCLYKLKLFSEEWSIYSAFQKHTHRYRIINFMKLFYPEYSSLKELDIEKANDKYIQWLRDTGISITEKRKYRHGGAARVTKVRTAAFLLSAYNSIMEYLDDRPLLIKDIWRIKDFQKQFDFDFHKSAPKGFIRFDSIKNSKLKIILKEYIRDRLLGKRHLSWHTGQGYAKTLSRLFNIIAPSEKEKNSLRNISRSDILDFIEWIRCYYQENKLKSVDNHLNNCMGQIRTFIEYLQLIDHVEAPIKSVRQLINPDDFPRYTQNRQINHIPDSVLEQLFNNLEYLNPTVTPIVWIAFKTGLRISDVLSLTKDCLVKINHISYLETDISKTKVHNHRLPIDDHLADILSFLIKKCEVETNLDNNPHRYLFPRLTGPRRGKPFYQQFVSEELNALAIDRNIVDESGNIFRFRMHEFRHTYAVKLLNNGADILTVQELLAHASPEMTMVYAKLLDDTKRKEFEKVMATGTFEFNQNGVLEQLSADTMDQDILLSIWQNHKINAIDNPYGTCLARMNGKCPFSTEPPCLSCNNGNPCKDLAIGLSNLDNEKYLLHIRTIQKTIDLLKEHNRMDMVAKNQQLLEKYIEIEEKISRGSVIYGRHYRIG
ncbi:hypothetical protein A5819_003631 [Enterococcus sp. 7E2_DIV0204]|uniref:tyrosine-type recombinase/integrase n=1 Tax=unclassified Enterococcus TaxID=2608891 RepID=UPI000A339EA7|nr:MULTISPECIES: tyrosine-type recombinase/integrase [unclassified Enterococcus]OTN83812.1 hypothetical protein A5819_003631 [Enterococcus sp. 7E2_DIV0204]OTP47536.1 hypothetical protein A5884_003507 [Enterococcus sp. 7D2_DIV0200]